mmetsp:Transcript_49725/g.153574  ORF Transcript_49725/g.153574 Transcript_49725/m.153574 type:complete len:205 (+) Transcript_49725:610-1224(+)
MAMLVSLTQARQAWRTSKMHSCARLKSSFPCGSLFLKRPQSSQPPAGKRHGASRSPGCEQGAGRRSSDTVGPATNSRTSGRSSHLTHLSIRTVPLESSSTCKCKPLGWAIPLVSSSTCKYESLDSAPATGWPSAVGRPEAEGTTGAPSAGRPGSHPPPASLAATTWPLGSPPKAAASLAASWRSILNRTGMLCLASLIYAACRR